MSSAKEYSENFHPWAYLAANRYYGSFLNSTVTPRTISANLLYACPILLGKTYLFDRIGVNVSTAVAGLARLGIYSSKEGLPDRLILDAGEVDTSTTGAKEITISQRLGIGEYFLVLVANAAPNFSASTSTVAFAFLLGASAVNSSPSTEVYASFSYAVLPDPFPSGISFNPAAAPFYVLLRRAA